MFRGKPKRFIVMLIPNPDPFTRKNYHVWDSKCDIAVPGSEYYGIVLAEDEAKRLNRLAKRNVVFPWETGR